MPNIKRYIRGKYILTKSFFFFFQRCGEISFDSPDQNAKCVRMLGKSFFSS